MAKKLIYQDSDSFAEISIFGENLFCISQIHFGDRNAETVVLSIPELERALDLAYEPQKLEGKKE